MDSDLAYIALAALAIVIVAWRVHALNKHEGKRFNFTSALDSVHDAVELIEKFAPAADQLVKIGHLPKHKRRSYVISLVRTILPNIEPSIVLPLVEAWVAQQNELKETGKPVEPNGEQ